jgi:hypothetical protein
MLLRLLVELPWIIRASRFHGVKGLYGVEALAARRQHGEFAAAAVKELIEKFEKRSVRSSDGTAVDDASQVA